MFSDPTKNVGFLELMEGMRVADFGAGSGAYSLAMAERVGDRGKIYAVDVQKELLTHIDRLSKEKRRRNIEVIWGNVEKVGGSKLADSSVDLVLIANVLFGSDARYTLASEAKRVTVPGGRVAVIDWTDSFGGLGPVANRVIVPAEAKRIFTEAGLTFVKDFPAGDHHYGLMFKK